MSTIEQLSCQELVELVTDYLEDALPPGERARFEDHISRCGKCTTYLDQMRLTIRTLGELNPEAISSEAGRALLEAFRDWKDP